MPELPEVESVRRELEPVMSGARISEVVLYRDGLRRAFPENLRDELVGCTIKRVDRRGKYLLAPLSSGTTLVIHLGMSGSFRVERGHVAVREPEKHDHVDIALASGAIVVFNDPRRFGLMDLIADGEIGERLGLGPEPLSDDFDAAVLARACARSKAPLKAILMDQGVVAGVGNIYASEALHRSRLSPKRRASTLVTPTGRPRERAVQLTEAVKAVLLEAVERQTGHPYRDSRFRVYDRDGERCPRRGCGGTIVRIVQAGRSSFYCPRCQR
ncbi:MAG: bifunctional DNA-formamidopyrimidine glycosylase/DNA-(apurinic or apyrimidinic site) lyase [Vicinamibacterales bacterium]